MACPELDLVLAKKTIDWELIAQEYDEMVKYMTALRLGTAQTEEILCRYLGSMELRQEINEGLNVIENWNGAYDFIYFGKGGEMASKPPRRPGDQHAVAAPAAALARLHQHLDASAGSC